MGKAWRRKGVEGGHVSRVVLRMLGTRDLDLNFVAVFPITNETVS